MGGRYRGLGKLPEPERCQNELDRNPPSGISVCFPVSIGFSACAVVVFMGNEGRHGSTGNISWSFEGKLPGGSAGGRNHSCPCLIPAWSSAPFVHEYCSGCPTGVPAFCILS